MEKKGIEKSELVLTSQGRIYHLNLKPEDISDTIFLVGDPGRVKVMSGFFDSIETVVENREFVTHTGYYKSKKVSVVSTGIGPDNIDIVINELDALFNIDLATRQIRDEKRKLNLIRIGTSGALHEDIEPGSVIVSKISCGLDNLLYYYKDFSAVTDSGLAKEFKAHMNWPSDNSTPYFVHSSAELLERLGSPEYFYGITLSAPGFYGPQGRTLRMGISDPDYLTKIESFHSGDLRINNFEMEGSALYGLSRILGHNALTICIALANRVSGKFITDYQPFVEKLLKDILSRMTDD